MFEQDLALETSTATDFVSHHPRFCSISPTQCKDRGLGELDAAMLFISALVARGIDPAALKLTDLERITPWFARRFSAMNTDFRGAVAFDDPAAISLARAVLDAYARREEPDLANLISLYDSRDDLVRSIAEAIARRFYTL